MPGLLAKGFLVKKLPQIKHIVCVASGKGGVGKSTTAVNLAVALRQLGCAVGLLDADIYGPSVPLMMGIAHGTRPEVREQRLLVPIEAHGVECISMGSAGGCQDRNGMARTYGDFGVQSDAHRYGLV